MYKKYQNYISIVCIFFVCIFFICVFIFKDESEKELEPVERSPHIGNIIEEATKTIMSYSEVSHESKDDSNKADEANETTIDFSETELHKYTAESSTDDNMNVANSTKNEVDTEKNEPHAKPPVPTEKTTKEESATDMTETTVAMELTATETEGERHLIDLGEFMLTAYCNCSMCCDEWAGGATASGVMPTSNRTIAVDTDIIPFGTEVVINGKTYTAEDTGSVIVGNRIDIYFDSHQEALNFGVQYANIYKVAY